MKKILKIIIISLLIFIGIKSIGVCAGVDLPDMGKIKDNSINYTSGGSVVGDINNVGISILVTIKLIFEGVLIIYIVYAGIQMVLSMGSNEEDLSSSKRSLRYSMIAIVFINIPGTLYRSFRSGSSTSISGDMSSSTWSKSSDSGGILVNFDMFGNTLSSQIIGFIEVAISAIAIVFIIISGINIIRSRGNDEDFGKAKNRITWSIVGLIFIGFIETWKSVIFRGDIEDGENLFETLGNLALFFAGPIGIFFLTLAAYYYINSNGDEERIKKAKNIVVNTVIATVILLASYTFLLDLATL